MDTAVFYEATKRLIKHKARMAIAARHHIKGMAEGMQPFADHLREEWQKTLANLGPLKTQDWDKLSILVNQAYVEATREIRDMVGGGRIVLDGMADFQENFRADDYLPPRVEA